MVPLIMGEYDRVMPPSAPEELAEEHDSQRDIERLVKLLESWPNRANVKKAAPDDGLVYDVHKPDFLVELLPFADHPLFREAPEPYRRAALSCGWLAYNEKTVAIESKIVGPACMHLIDGNVPSFDSSHREVVAQAIVDEAYHILLVVHANALTRRFRGLNHLQIPSFDLVTSMQRTQEEQGERWKKILIHLATAVVSEVLVSDYLSKLSGAPGIQPINRITTEIHRRDESAHNGLFKSLGALIYHGLSAREREFFVRALTLPSTWFASPELDVWEAMLAQIGFPGGEQIIRDCRAQRQTRGIHLDLKTLDTLFADLGVENRLRSSVCSG